MFCGQAERPLPQSVVKLLNIPVLLLSGFSYDE